MFWIASPCPPGSLVGSEQQRQRLTETRITFLTAVLGNGDFVRIEVIPFGERARASEDSFRDCLGRQDGAFADAILNEDQNAGVLAELYADLPDDPAQRCAQFAVRIRALKSGIDSIRGGETRTPGRRRFQAYIRQMKPEQMDRLHVWWPEDGLRMQYRESTTGKFVRPTEFHHRLLGVFWIIWNSSASG